MEHTMTAMHQPVSVVLPTYAALIDTTVSTEGYDIVSKIPAFFTNKLSTVVSFFHSSEVSFFDNTAKEQNVYFRELAKNRRVLLKAKGKIDYAMVKRRKVPVVIGLDTDVLTFANVLRESNKLVLDNVEDLLNETAKLIARLVTDKEFRLASRPIMIDKKYSKAVSELEDNIGKVLSNKAISDNRTVKEIMPSVPHLEEAISVALEYGDNNTTDVYTGIRDKVAVITNYAESLHAVFKEDGVDIKKHRIEEVAEYLQVSANFVTQSINTLYLSNQSVIIMNNLVKIITTVR